MNFDLVSFDYATRKISTIRVIRRIRTKIASEEPDEHKGQVRRPFFAIMLSRN